MEMARHPAFTMTATHVSMLTPRLHIPRLIISRICGAVSKPHPYPFIIFWLQQGPETYFVLLAFRQGERPKWRQAMLCEFQLKLPYFTAIIIPKGHADAHLAVKGK